jgi:hypothetical protein
LSDSKASATIFEEYNGMGKNEYKSKSKCSRSPEFNSSVEPIKEARSEDKIRNNERFRLFPKQKRQAGAIRGPFLAPLMHEARRRYFNIRISNIIWLVAGNRGCRMDAARRWLRRTEIRPAAQKESTNFPRLLYSFLLQLVLSKVKPSFRLFMAALGASFSA